MTEDKYHITIILELLEEIHDQSKCSEQLQFEAISVSRWQEKNEKTKVRLTQKLLVIFSGWPSLLSNFRFSYYRHKQSRYVLVLDKSEYMSVNDRWFIVQKSLFKLISRIPSGSELAIVTFGGGPESLVVPFTIVTDSNR